MYLLNILSAQSAKMEQLHYAWKSQNKDIWRVAFELKKNNMQVDVRLQGMKDCENICGPQNHNKENNSTGNALLAHRIMLAAASPFLSKVLREHYSDHHDAFVNIILPDVSEDTLHYILEFIYCGRLGIPSSALKNVEETAKRLEISSLVTYLQSERAMLEASYKVRTIKIEQKEENFEYTIKVPPKKRGRKRKAIMLLSKGGDSQSLPCSSVKEEVIDNNDLESEVNRYGRYRRKIKCKYSSDMYKISLPKVRDQVGRSLDTLRRKGSKIHEEPKEISSSFNNENLHTYALKLSPKNSANNILNRQEAENTNNFSAETNILDLRLTRQDQLHANIIAAQPSASSPSIVSSVIPNLFTTDASYIQEPHEIPCVTFIESPSAHTKQNSGVPTLSVSVISPLGELPVVSAPPLHSGSLQNTSLKYVSEMCKPQEVSSVPEDEEEEDEPEEEDGLFKLQVLLKDCEDYHESLTPQGSHPPSSQNVEDSEMKHEGPTEGVDIRQWISEEIKNSVIKKSHLQGSLGTNDSDVKINCHLYTAQESSGFQEKQQVLDKIINNEEVIHEIGVEQHSRNKALEEYLGTNVDGLGIDICKKEKVTYECKNCGRVYADFQSRKLHIQNVHNEAKQMCKHCGKMFRRRCDLYEHERRHNDAKLPCRICGKIFKLSKDLTAHMRTHTGGKRFKCTQCNKELTSFRNLKNHIAGVHQRERSYACHMCNKTYAKSSALQVHIRSVHTGERPYVCKICGKTFCNPSLLKLHEVSHTGEQKYSCKVCHRKFSQYCNMRSHQRVHSNERPFVCVICKESYKTKESLYKHKWIHTGLKPLRCRHCSKEYRVKESYERHMLKHHDEVVHLPQIYFEMSDKMTLENVSDVLLNSNKKTVSNINNVALVEAPTIELTESIHNKLPDPKALSAELPQNIVPVIQFVNDLSQTESSSIELTTNDTGQLHLNPDEIQINYPILSTEPPESKEGVTATLSMAEGDLTHPIESLLQVSIPGTSSSVIMTEDGKVNILLDC